MSDRPPFLAGGSECIGQFGLMLTFLLALLVGVFLPKKPSDNLISFPAFCPVLRNQRTYLATL